MGINNSLAHFQRLQPAVYQTATQAVNQTGWEQRAVWSAWWHKQINPFSDTQLPRDSMSCLWQSVRDSQDFAYKHTCPQATGSFTAERPAMLELRLGIGAWHPACYMLFPDKIFLTL